MNIKTFKYGGIALFLGLTSLVYGPKWHDEMRFSSKDAEVSDCFGGRTYGSTADTFSSEPPGYFCRAHFFNPYFDTRVHVWWNKWEDNYEVHVDVPVKYKLTRVKLEKATQRVVESDPSYHEEEEIKRFKEDTSNGDSLEGAVHLLFSRVRTYLDSEQYQLDKAEFLKPNVIENDKYLIRTNKYEVKDFPPLEVINDEWDQRYEFHSSGIKEREKIKL
ncbi:MAG: hypothetical protein WCV90_02240 [Candidatus Woesearchaeota archaeon]|jgi:hypothetical protein